MILLLSAGPYECRSLPQCHLNHCHQDVASKLFSQSQHSSYIVVMNISTNQSESDESTSFIISPNYSLNIQNIKQFAGALKQNSGQCDISHAAKTQQDGQISVWRDSRKIVWSSAELCLKCIVCGKTAIFVQTVVVSLTSATNFSLVIFHSSLFPPTFPGFFSFLLLYARCSTVCSYSACVTTLSKFQFFKAKFFVFF